MIIGIDPGLKGSVFVWSNNPDFYTLPFVGNRLNSHAFKQIVASFLLADCKHVFIEKPIAFPGQSCVATATTFENYGRMMAIIETSGLEYTEIAPKDWTKKMFAGMPKPTTPKTKKIRSLKRAWQVFPKLQDMIETDGQADAALIAYYGQSQIGKE
jgi:hypothetical protein